MIFDLTNKVAIITGGAGLLGKKHAEAIAEIGGTPILLDINEKALKVQSDDLKARFPVPVFGIKTDISKKTDVENCLKIVLKKYGKVDILINNAAHNPKMEDFHPNEWTRLENFSIKYWNNDIEVGLTGAFLCSRFFGAEMAKQKKGIIVNVSSDLGIIAPDQRIYRKESIDNDRQPVKPVSYSVIKHGLIGLTKYLATYWADKGIRVNALCPGGVYDGQSDEFVEKLTQRIPLGRMAGVDEYKGAIQFLCSDASSYMTGACLVIDGGRTTW